MRNFGKAFFILGLITYGIAFLAWRFEGFGATWGWLVVGTVWVVVGLFFGRAGRFFGD